MKVYVLTSYLEFERSLTWGVYTTLAGAELAEVCVKEGLWGETDIEEITLNGELL